MTPEQGDALIQQQYVISQYVQDMSSRQAAFGDYFLAALTLFIMFALIVSVLMRRDRV